MARLVRRLITILRLPRRWWYEMRKRRLVTAWAKYRATLESMSEVQAIGAILARAQIIEEAMRNLITMGSDEYDHPREVNGTFGQLVVKFKRVYPSQGDLIDLLETARDIRNDAAHTDLLVAHSIRELLSDLDSEAVDRFQRRGARKTIEGMDLVVRAILRFLKAREQESTGGSGRDNP